jgi:hypothetical protein
MPTVVDMCGGGLTVTRNVDAGRLRAAVAVAHGVVSGQGFDGVWCWSNPR